MGDYAAALSHLRTCLSLEAALWGADNRHSADTVFNIGLTTQLAGDARAALPHFERAHALYARFLDRDHPAVARAAQRLAQARAEL
jgi:tetratricopeptide (TPR) repeat protein